MNCFSSFSLVANAYRNAGQAFLATVSSGNNHLESFIDKVRPRIAPGNPALAETWIRMANAIIDGLPRSN